MTTQKLDLPGLIKKYHISPKKSLGQNFLWDPNILDRIIDAAELPSTAEVLEIGTGLGTLTCHLAENARKVRTVEIDRKLQPILEEVLGNYPNVDLIMGDILSLDPVDIMENDGYFVVANIPYYLTSALMRHLLESPCKPKRFVLTLQYEVAKRVCANPGSMSLLALSIQVYGQPRLEFKIPAGAFYPVPEVDSAVLRVDVYPEPHIQPELLDLFFQLIKAGFHQKRKKLRNSLAEGMRVQVDQVETALVLAGVDPGNRAQMLDLDEWTSILRVWQEKMI